MTVDGEELQERVRVRAYYLWDAQGRPMDGEHEFWYQAEASELTRPVRELEDLRDRVAEGSAHFQGLGIEEKPYAIGAGIANAYHTDPISGVAYVGLTNGKADALSGRHTGGYCVKLPDKIEAAASGHHVAVSVVARAAAGGPSRFAIAYSTNEVGNSGWRWFSAEPQWSIFRTEYNVPVMKNGLGDFVGILPDVEGRPGIELCFLAIVIS